MLEIIIRGKQGEGKTTLANKLFNILFYLLEKEVYLIDENSCRRTMKQPEITIKTEDVSGEHPSEIDRLYCVIKDKDKEIELLHAENSTLKQKAGFTEREDITIRGLSIEEILKIITKEEYRHPMSCELLDGLKSGEYSLFQDSIYPYRIGSVRLPYQTTQSPVYSKVKPDR